MFNSKQNKFKNKNKVNVIHELTLKIVADKNVKTLLIKHGTNIMFKITESDVLQWLDVSIFYIEVVFTAFMNNLQFHI